MTLAAPVATEAGTETERPAAPLAAPAPVAGPEVVPAVEARDLHFHYSTSDGSIHGISFRIESGECVALIGPNGAGKSTLLLHLNGILPERHDARLCGGAVYVFGRQVTPHNLYEIRRQVGLLFQDPEDQLFCPTVGEDVAFGPQQFGLDRAQVEERVKQSLARVGLAGFEPRSPHRLSGGEKRRVALAGVLACEPKVLVLDEPTSNLDPRGRREFKALLKTLPATKIIATHDLELVLELCPRTLVMDGGQIVAHGPSRELLSNEPLMLRHGLETPPSLRGQSGGSGGTTAGL